MNISCDSMLDGHVIAPTLVRVSESVALCHTTSHNCIFKFQSLFRVMPFFPLLLQLEFLPTDVASFLLIFCLQTPVNLKTRQLILIMCRLKASKCTGKI